MTVEIYTDGSCLKNPGGPGGWAALIIADGIEKELVGSESATTNNRMELRAALEAMRTLVDGTEAKVFTDSQYLQNGITTWMPAWKRKGWKRAKGNVKNVDLWQEIDRHNKRLNLSWSWVKGHAGQPQNEKVDQLAREAALTLSLNQIPEESPEAPQSERANPSRHVAVCIGRPFKNDMPGGWYVRVRDPDGHIQACSGIESQESSQALELVAAIKAIEAAPAGCALRLRTSSDDLVSGATTKLARWRSDGWKDSAGNAISCQDEWQRLFAVCATRKVEWESLKGLEKAFWCHKAECWIDGGSTQAADSPA